MHGACSRSVQSLSYLRHQPQSVSGGLYWDEPHDSLWIFLYPPFLRLGEQASISLPCFPLLLHPLIPTPTSWNKDGPKHKAFLDLCFTTTMQERRDKRKKSPTKEYNLLFFSHWNFCPLPNRFHFVSVDSFYILTWPEVLVNWTEWTGNIVESLGLHWRWQWHPQMDTYLKPQGWPNTPSSYFLSLRSLAILYNHTTGQKGKKISQVSCLWVGRTDSSFDILIDRGMVSS